MDERREPVEDNTQALIPRGEKVQILLSFSLGVPKQIIASLAEENEIDLGGRFTAEGLSVLTQAAKDWKDTNNGLRNNLNGNPEASTEIGVQSLPAAVGSSAGAAVRDASRNGSITENQPGTAENPHDAGQDHAAIRILAARNKDPERRKGPPPNPIFAHHTRRPDPDIDPSVPVGYMRFADVARMLNVTGERAQEIVDEHGVDSERVEGVNCYPKERIEEIKRERDAKEISDCPAHHWMILSPNGPTSEGTCKLCKKKKEFKNGGER